MVTTLVIIFTICLVMFPLSAIDKIFNFKKSSDRLVKNLPMLNRTMSDILIICAIVLQLVAPLLIMYSIITKKAKTIGMISSVLLALFTIAATLIFYMPPTGNKYYALLGNTTTLGCMLLITYELNKIIA